MTRVVESSEDTRHSRRRGCGGSAAAASHSFLASAGSARASGLDMCADRASVAAFECGPDSCVLELASSDDLADAVGDQLDGARCGAVRHADACLDYAAPDDLTHVADWLQQRAADGAEIPDRIGFAFPAA